MKTIILNWENDIDLYNDKSKVNNLLEGKQAEWRLWTAGDARCAPTKAQKGDRFFICQKDYGIIAAGFVENIEIERKDTALAACAMAHLLLNPEKCGKLFIPIEKLTDIISHATKSKSEDEMVLDTKYDIRALECMWVEAMIDNNPSFNKTKPEDWSFEKLNEETIAAIHKFKLAEDNKCPCCGNDLTVCSELFFRPSLAMPTINTIKSFKDVISQYVLLCKDCAAIEKAMK